MHCTNFVGLPHARITKRNNQDQSSISRASDAFGKTVRRKLKRGIIENKLCTVYFRFVSVVFCGSIISGEHRSLFPFEWMDAQAFSSLSKRVFDIRFDKSIPNHGEGDANSWKRWKLMKKNENSWSKSKGNNQSLVWLRAKLLGSQPENGVNCESDIHYSVHIDKRLFEIEKKSNANCIFQELQSLSAWTSQRKSKKLISGIRRVVMEFWINYISQMHAHSNDVNENRTYGGC